MVILNLVKMASQDPNRAAIESKVRKDKYKKILERGAKAAEECDTNTLVQNIQQLSDMILESNQLLLEGALSDRVGQSAEVLLDIQVKFSYFLCINETKCKESFIISTILDGQNGARNNGQNRSENRAYKVQ